MTNGLARGVFDLIKRRLIAFDLDGTLAVTKSAISDVMAARLKDLLSLYEVCVISGGKFDQSEKQLVEQLDVSPEQMSRLQIMPTSGTRHFWFDDRSLQMVMQYAQDLSPQKRAEIVEVLTNGAKELGYPVKAMGVDSARRRQPWPSKRYRGLVVSEGVGA